MAVLRHNEMEDFKEFLSALRWSVIAPRGWRIDEVVVVRDDGAGETTRIRFDANGEPYLSIEEADR